MATKKCNIVKISFDDCDKTFIKYTKQNSETECLSASLPHYINNKLNT